MQHFLPATQCVVLTIFFLCTSVISDNKCTFKYGFSYESDDYMYAPMTDASVNSTARLVSPWFGATEDRQYTLQFRYYMGQSDNCQLAVVLEIYEEAPSFKQLFSTRNGTGSSFKSVSPIWLPFVDCSHRIVFEARKVTEGSCGYVDYLSIYNHVGVDDIAFIDAGLMTTTTPSVPRQSTSTDTPPSSSLTSMTVHSQTTNARPSSTVSFTTAEPAVPASVTSLTSGTQGPSKARTTDEDSDVDEKEGISTAHTTDEDNDVDEKEGVRKAPTTDKDNDVDEKEQNIGLIAGISVIVVVVIVAALVLLVFLQRRKTRNADNKRRGSSSKSGPVLNAAYTPHEDAVIIGHGTVNSQATNGAGTSASGQASDSVGADILYSKPKKVRPKHGDAVANKNPQIPSHAGHNGEDEYNMLSQNNSPITSLDSSPSNTYNHLAQQRSGDQRGRDQTPQGNQGNASPDEDQYNALDRRHPPAPNSDPGAASHADVKYSHLGDQDPLQTNQIPGAKNTPASPDDDQYNVLGRQNLTRPTQNAEDHEDVEYSHVNKQANPPSTGATHSAKSPQRKRAPEDYVNVALMEDEAGLQSKDTDDEYNALDFNKVSQLAPAQAENLYDNTV